MLGQSRRIVVLGGGFAGVYAACALERKFWRHPEVEIMLVSDENVLLLPLCFRKSHRALVPDSIVIVCVELSREKLDKGY